MCIVHAWLFIDTETAARPWESPPPDRGPEGGASAFQIFESLLIAVQAWALRILMSLLDVAIQEPR